jgi:hypothetical protein
MATKMTAVEWLRLTIQNKLASEMGPFFAEAFETAKVVEREYMMQMYTAGKLEGIKEGPQTANEYFTETFNS